MLCMFLTLSFLLVSLNLNQPTDYNKFEWEKTVKNINTGIYYDSIQKAINAAETKDNHTIIVSSGIYNEQVIINKSISLVGTSLEGTILEGGACSPVIEVICNNVVIKNFTIRNPVHYAYGIKLFRSNSSLLTNLIVKDTHIGLVLFQSNGNEILHINTENSSIGILLDYSTKNRLLSNEITECVTGIRLGACSQQNVIEKNQIESNTNGIELGNQANFNIFVNNYFKKNERGVFFGGLSKNCTFIGNILSYNERGVEFFLPSTNNRFFHNSFFFNKVQVYSNYIEAINIWDGDYPLGGNFWSDYHSTDLYSGLYQNKSGRDGIGDASYSIDFDKDNYPLIGSFIKIANVTTIDGEVLFFGCSANFTIKELDFIEKNNSLVIKTFNENIPFFCRLVIPKNFLIGANQQLNVTVNGQVILNGSMEVNKNYISLFFIYTPPLDQNEPPLIPNFYIIAFLIILLAFFFMIIRIFIVSKSRNRTQKMDSTNDNAIKDFIILFSIQAILSLPLKAR